MHRHLARVALYGGVVVAVVALSKVHAVASVPGYDYTGSSRFGWSFAYIALLCLAAYGLGLPDLARGRRVAVVAAAGATSGGALGISAIQLLTGTALLPRWVVFGAAVVLVPWFVLCATVAREGVTRAEGRDRVLLVAGPGEAVVLEDELGQAPERPASVVAHLDVEAARAGDGPGRPLVEQADALDATVVVLDRHAQADESIVAQAAALHAAGVRIRTLSLFYEQWLGKLPVSELERVSLMFDIGELHRARYGRAKRLLDVALALGGLVLLAVVTPLVLAGNAVANRGPLLFRQRRVGKQGRTFQILKFRTMGGEATSAATGEWTSEHDPRITPFGNLLRRTHLDELPQVWNIVRGDLSVVGPRPEQPRYVGELTDKLPFYDLRHLVRPGLTGWAQVKYGYAGCETDALEKLQYEFYYLRRQSLGFDLRVMGRTVRSVLRGAGR
ncbi:MAG TPA: sugar transferase [Acidimicrobiales bacterium]|nr:sugar transferase [Acidimicrobiales bacterium]